jgi:arsenate reductase
MFSNTFAGIAPAAVPGFVVAQLIGGAAALLAIAILYPDVTPAEAADAVLPHPHQSIAADRR